MNRKKNYKPSVVRNYSSAILLMVLLMTMMFSCKKSPLTNGDTITETRELSSFSNLYLNDNIDVTLVNSDIFKIEITTGENLMTNIISDVIDDALYIRNENICNWLRSYDYPLEARIYYSGDIKEIIYESVGGLRTEGYLENDSTRFMLYVENGAGDIDLKLNCDSIFINIHEGTNDIKLEGSSNYTYIYQQGFGPVNAANLPSSKMFVNSHTDNNIFIHCTDNLDAKIYNSGNIYYKGQPEINSYISPDALGRLIEIENLKN